MSDMSERTLAIIKPDAVKARHSGRIIQRIEDAGFTIRAMRLVNLSQKEAEGFYAVHRERPFFGSLTKFMSSGPAVVLALEVGEELARPVLRGDEPERAGDENREEEEVQFRHRAPGSIRDCE